MAGIEENSFRIGVAVTVVARLFDPATESDKTLLPTAGPAAIEPVAPTLILQGTEGTDDYRRIWRVLPPSNGSPFVKLASTSGAIEGVDEAKSLGLVGAPVLDKFSGFEQPLPDETKSPPPDDSGDDHVPFHPAIVGDPTDPNVAYSVVLARGIRLRLNAHRLADECDLELPIEALPFAPDGSLLRSVLVEIRRGVIDADVWAEAMRTGQVGLDGRPLTLPVQTDTDEPDFVGFVDKQKFRMRNGSATTVSLSLRDLAGVLADAKTRGRTIDNDLPADEAIARFVSTLPAAVGLDVVWRGPAQPPTLGDAAPKAKKSKSGKTRARQQKNDSANFLDAIADYCTLCGVIPTFRGYRLELAPARTLDQFDATSVHRMVLGHNIEELELEHRMAGAATRAVEVRCLNPDTGKVVCARYPEDPNRDGEHEAGEIDKQPPTGPIDVPPGASGVDERAPTVMNVFGITDQRRLRDIAQSVFEEQARQDLQGRIVTKDIATAEGRGLGVADLLALRAGDPIGIFILPSIEALAGSYIQRLATMSNEAAIAMLVSAGYARKVAETLVPRIIANQRPLVYRVREVDFDYQMDGGTTIEIAIINLIEVVDAELRGTRKPGGNRRAAVLRGATFAELHKAIDDDYIAGEITQDEALRLQQGISDLEAQKQHPELLGATPPPKSYATGAPTPASKLPKLFPGKFAF